EVIFFIEENKIKLGVSYDELLDILVSNSLESHEAEHGEGFWTDHWTYNLDLLENYFSLYPEKRREIIFDKRIFTFFDNAEVIKNRRDKYVLRDKTPKQLHSVVLDSAKKEMIRKRTAHPHLVRTEYGLGRVYQTTLMNKLLCLLANKLASLDPFGTGIEMEADKPNWFDALNGLPAIFGSSLCETFELKRLTLIIKDLLEESGMEVIHITEEINVFLTGLDKLLQEYLNSSSTERDFQYWDKSYSLKEEYRAKTRFGFSGKEPETSVAELIAILKRALAKIDAGIDRAFDKKSNVYTAYFINEVSQYRLIKEHFIQPLKFTQKKLPAFLEAQMHALRIAPDTKTAKILYGGIKRSPLYDTGLKMYKCTASLSQMPEEIGRCRVFTPGWLEHESIWLHMEYKYLLEVLRSGLYEEFYADFKNALIPFQNAARYGRNILENSSFLVSSAFPDKKLHGRGFVARLSGSTAEFLSIWLAMNLGPNPFFLVNGELNFKFEPKLAGWLFRKKEKTYSFNFLGRIDVVYHNALRKDTFGKKGATCKKILFNDKAGNPVEITGNTIPAPYALQVRDRKIKRIDIYLED
ncbi:MAG: cellobiose phosphorylase, partial [Candidatus Omnitrophica bacterium]|nr:cellobiose phosphorylase [Candidatus Omnitrophota bacterium]